MNNIIAFSVVNQKYKIQVHDEYVMAGNTAVLKCQVRLLVIQWAQSERVFFPSHF